MKRITIFLIIPLLFLSGCLQSLLNFNTQSTSETPIPSVKTVTVSLITPYGDNVEEDYARSVGFSFDFRIETPYEGTVTLCLNSFSSGYWKITGARCVKKYVKGSETASLPDGGRIYLKEQIDHDLTERIIVNQCFDYTQTYVLTGCLKKDTKCTFSIDEKTSGYISVSNVFSKYDLTKDLFTLNFKVTYFPRNWTYITDNYDVLNNKCYLSQAVSPEKGEVSVLADLLICANKCEHVKKKIMLSSSGESKLISIELPTDVKERDIISIVLNMSYVVFREIDYGSVTVVHSS